MFFLAGPSRHLQERLYSLEFLQACREVRDHSLHAQQSGSGTYSAVTGTRPPWLLLHDRVLVMSACHLLSEAAFLPAEFQEQSSARIQLSRTNDFFPGTSDRIMLVAGPVNQVD